MLKLWYLGRVFKTYLKDIEDRHRPVHVAPGITEDSSWEEVSGERMGTALVTGTNTRQGVALRRNGLKLEGGAGFRLDFEIRAQQWAEVTH